MCSHRGFHLPGRSLPFLCEVRKIQYREDRKAGGRTRSSFIETATPAGFSRGVRLCMLGIALGGLFLLLLKNPAVTAAASLDGILLAAKTVLPSTFPYMILSGVLTGSGVTRSVGKFLRSTVERIFHLPPEGAAVILLGLLSGFPVGAKCAADLYLAGDCTKEEAERMLCFCNFCGPPFILGSVAGFLGSPAAALTIYLTQTAGMLALGVFLGMAARKKAKKRAADAIHRAPDAVREEEPPSGEGRAIAKPFSLVFYESVKSACTSMLQIAGFVVFFSILNGILEKISILRSGDGNASRWAITALRGILEISGGARAAAATAPAIGMSGAIFCTALVTVWSGFSVHMQVSSFALPAGLKMGKYYLSHLIMAVIVAAVATGICAAAGIT